MKSILLSLLMVVSLTLAACGKTESGHSDSDGHDHAEESGSEKSGHDDEHESHVELSPEQLRAAGLKIDVVGAAAISETLPLYGVIAPNAERTQEVSARFPGVIRSVAARIGDEVQHGAVLASVESDESLQSYPISTPLSGVVIARNANPGEQSSGRVLFTVADLSTVWVELSLFPRDLAKVRVGQRVKVKSVDAGLSAEGELIYVSPVGSNASQTLTGRVLLENPDRRWAPGLYVSALVTLGEQSVPVTVLSSALQMLEEDTVVFVQDEDGGFEPRPVRTGRSDGEVTEILEGLSDGERYASVNSFVLKSQLGAGSADHGH